MGQHCFAWYFPFVQILYSKYSKRSNKWMTEEEILSSEKRLDLRSYWFFNHFLCLRLGIQDKPYALPELSDPSQDTTSPRWCQAVVELYFVRLMGAGGWSYLTLSFCLRPHSDQVQWKHRFSHSFFYQGSSVLGLAIYAAAGIPKRLRAPCHTVATRHVVQQSNTNAAKYTTWCHRMGPVVLIN